MSLHSLSLGRIASTVTISPLAVQHSFSSRLPLLGLGFKFITTQWLNRASRCRQFSVSALALGRRWTEEEDLALRKLTQEGVPPADIAKKLDRTVPAIFGGLRRLGMRCTRPLRRPAKPWSQEEHAQARALLERGVSVAATAETLGRSYSALHGHLRHFATQRPDPSYLQAARKDTISSETVNKLIEMKSCGLSWSEIQAAIPEHQRITLMMAWKRRLEHGRLQDQPYAVRWTDEESGLLLRLRGDQKLAWSSIERYIPGRSRDALAKRYKKMHGVPESSNPSKYTLNELELLAKLKAGSHPWPEIAAHIPGRSLSSLRTTYQHRVADGYSIDPDGSVQWTEEWKARNQRVIQTAKEQDQLKGRP